LAYLIYTQQFKKEYTMKVRAPLILIYLGTMLL